MAALTIETPVTTTPCCGRRIRFNVFADVPRQTFDRTCRTCGRKYDVEVRVLRRSAAVVIRAIEWDWTGRYDARVRAHYLKYGE